MSPRRRLVSHVRPRSWLRPAAMLSLALAGAFVLSQALGGPVGYVIVSGRSMEPLLHTDDLALVVRQSSYHRGDVVAFRVPKGDPGAGSVVIHRITGGSARDGYITQGDNRNGRDPWRPVPSDVVGEMAFHVPKLGGIPAFLSSPLGLALAAGLFGFLLIARGGSPKHEEDDEESAPVQDLPPVAADATPAVPTAAPAWDAAVAAAPTKLRPIILAAGAVATAGAALLVVRAARRSF